MKSITTHHPQSQCTAEYHKAPLLFIIFINDITDYIRNVKISLYADDTAFYLSSTDKTRELTIAANAFDKWCGYNRLTLIHEKTKSVIFTPSQNHKHQSDIPPIKIGDSEIDRLTEFKYLGVTLDQNLNFENHIKKILQKIMCRMQTLKEVRWTFKRCTDFI